MNLTPYHAKYYAHELTRRCPSDSVEKLAGTLVDAQADLNPHSELIPIERVCQAIILLRGQKVMLDRDLAALYGVPTKALKQAVKRNAGRFPADFMFALTADEFAEWRSQFVTSKADRMGLRYAPIGFSVRERRAVYSVKTMRVAP